MYKFKHSIDAATRMARDYVNAPRKVWTIGTGWREVPRDYRATLAECRAYILDARDNWERINEFREGHDGAYPKFGDVELSWDRAHDTEIFRREDGTAYCRLIEAVSELGLAR